MPGLRERRGEAVSSVLRLKCEEPVRLDRSQLEILYQSLGPVGADKVVGHALEELGQALATASRHYREGEITPLRDEMRAIVALSQQVGMTLLARVARDALELSNTYDAAAFGATMARLERIGEGSLVAIWDLQDLSV